MSFLSWENTSSYSSRSCDILLFVKYGSVKRIGVLMGLDYDDDTNVMVRKNKAGAIVAITPLRK